MCTICLLMTDWIASVAGDDRSAYCKVCDIVLPAHHAGLTKHSQNSQHLLRLASFSQPTKKISVHNVSLPKADSNVKSQVDCLKVFVKTNSSLGCRHSQGVAMVQMHPRARILNKFTQFAGFYRAALNVGRSSEDKAVCLFVCPSVCLSNVWIVTKRKKNLSRFLYHAKDDLV